MKQLQNDFTTPEQSKRLLELGVPADSADCYLTRFGIDEDWEIKVLNNNVKYSELAISNQDYCLPCWSVGRLIEIYVIARGIDTSFLLIERGEDMVQYLIRLYEDRVKDLDFSKLED